MWFAAAFRFRFMRMFMTLDKPLGIAASLTLDYCLYLSKFCMLRVNIISAGACT